MSVLRKGARRLPKTARAAAAFIVASAIAGPAAAVTYQFDFGGPVGSFEAPLGGGLITAFNVVIGDTVFDTVAAGPTQPVYNPVLNTFNNLIDVEFRGAGSSTGNVFNSAPSGSCPIGDLCVLELFDTVGGTAAPEWAFQNVTQATNVAGGFYSIDPVPATPTVPVPAALPFLAAALALLAGLKWRGRREPSDDFAAA